MGEKDETKEGGGTPTTSERSTSEKKYADFDSFFEKADEEVKSLIDNRFKNLENALATVKEDRNTLKEQIARIQKDKSLDSEGKLAELQKQVEESSRKAAFFESCPKELNSPKNAFILARAHDCIRKDGSLDVEEFKKLCPEQFSKVAVTQPTGAGTGSGETSAEPFDMNNALRGMAGVRS